MSIQWLSGISSEWGQEALQSIIQVSGKRNYKKIFQSDGYVAEWSKEDNMFYLIENNDPIDKAATTCSKFCLSELNIFQTLLGLNGMVSRNKHILSGQRRCL